MKYMKNQFDEIIQSIKDNFEKYQRGHYDTKKYTYFLANGDKIDYKLNSSCIAHLLGIDTTYLMSTSLFKEKDSYGLLTKIIEDNYKIYSSINQGILDQERLFSPYIQEKNEIFIENLVPKIDDASFVCKYNKERTYGFSDFSSDCDYIICRELPTGDLILLMLVKDSCSNSYIARSSQILKTDREKEEKLSSLLYNQDITFITSTSYHDQYTDYRSNPYFYDNKNKSAKVTELKQKYSKYNTTIDVSGDYAFYMNKIAKNRENKRTASGIMENISDVMRKRNIIDMEQLDEGFVLDEKVIEILTAYNDSLCGEVSDTVSETYTSIKDENSSLKEELESVREKLLALKQVSSEQQTQIDILTMENGSMQKKIGSISEIINS